MRARVVREPKEKTMRYILMAMIGAALLAVGTDRAVVAADKAGEFFNGKNLEGWEGIAQYWSVKDGAIVGHAAKDPGFNTFLCSKKKYGDFEMSFQIRLKDGKGNSGVQIRSEVIDQAKHVVRGPQCDIGAQYWGSLYGERFGGMMKAAPAEIVKKFVKPSDFNDYAIKCVGKHVTIKVNGQTTVDGDFPKMPDTGIIAFQLHAGGPMEVTYKNIQFKDLGKRNNK
jgi:3-keto-disaccharide hydrolase